MGVDKISKIGGGDRKRGSRFFEKIEDGNLPSSLFHLMLAVARAHASTRVTSLMRIKDSTPTSVYNTYSLGRKENERNTKSIKLNSYHFSLTFLNFWNEVSRARARV